jgi:hypothetical protein
MRKIESKEKIKKRQKRNQFIVGGILIIVMFGSVFGMIVGSFGKSSTNKINYNGLKFENQNGFWKTQIGNIPFIFQFNPEEIEGTNSSLNLISSYSGKPLYVSSENYNSKAEIYRNLNSITERTQDACFGEECEEDLPTKTCDDNFIIIQISNDTSITQDKNCVFIKGKQEDLLKLTDAFLYKILGIK